MVEEAAPVLLYWERLPPAEVVAAASIAKVAITPCPDPKANGKDYVISLKFSDGRVLEGLPMILKYIARAAAPDTPPLYGNTALESCTIDQWMDYCNGQFVSGPGLQAAVASAGESLALRTFMVGHTLSIADLCGWGKIQTAAMWMKVRNTPEACNVRRWFEFCSQQPPVATALERLAPKKVGKDAKATNTMSRSAKSTTKTVDAASLDMALPGAKQGAVVTRFPPEPSGYLHIGHAKAALLNQIFADRYEGKLIVRFDDTNPSKENEEFVGNIVDDMEKLGLKYGGVITYASDHFPGMIDIARKMIQAGHMYADDTDVDTMRTERMACTPSKNRDQKPEETLKIFDDEMLKGTADGQKYCLRVRLDMANANACLRDPVAYRCNDHPHWRCGTKFKCYPTYDFACPYVDSSQGVTHALRTNEYRDREEQFQRIHKLMKQSKPELPTVIIWDYSRLNFVNTVLSKRKLQKLVDTGVVQGWTDPRFPTVQGIMRRGMQIEALREFIMAQGASKNNNLQQWDKIWAINKQVIDPVAPRHVAVTKDGKVPVTVSNGPTKLELLTIPKHKKNPDVGSKTLYRTSSILIDQDDAQALSEGEEVTLMDWGNCIMREVTKGADGKVAAIKGDLHLEGDFKKTKLKLTWLADVPDVVPLRLVTLGDLITKAKLEEEDNFDDFVNRDSWHEVAALGDPNMRALQQDDVIQLERKGYFKVDEAMTKPDKPLLLFSIPDGRQKK